jgi:hypothetical protein
MKPEDDPERRVAGEPEEISITLQAAAPPTVEIKPPPEIKVGPEIAAFASPPIFVPKVDFPKIEPPPLNISREIPKIDFPKVEPRLLNITREMPKIDFSPVDPPRLNITRETPKIDFPKAEPPPLLNITREIAKLDFHGDKKAILRTRPMKDNGMLSR